ncbi:unnamed protein product [Ambrosiozyma monospora]|uniref:Unnamed protein product n=1 Tax=Ambrosiozyma monospora TaxID=43982 RepID=A0ACB5T069_AMBMO|nr:unnamed protein product [Ambrosiozyma monospora]
MSEPSNNTHPSTLEDESVTPDQLMTSTSAQDTVKGTTEEQSELTHSESEIHKDTSNVQITEQLHTSYTLESSVSASKTVEGTTEEPSTQTPSPHPESQTTAMDTTEDPSSSTPGIQQTVEETSITALSGKKSSLEPSRTMEETTEEPSERSSSPFDTQPQTTDMYTNEDPSASMPDIGQTVEETTEESSFPAPTGKTLSPLPSQTVEETAEELSTRSSSPFDTQPQTTDMDTAEVSSTFLPDIQPNVEETIEDSSIPAHSGQKLSQTMEETTEEPSARTPPHPTDMDTTEDPSASMPDIQQTVEDLSIAAHSGQKSSSLSTGEPSARTPSPSASYHQTTDMDTSEDPSASVPEIQRTVQEPIEESSFSTTHPTIQETTEELFAGSPPPSHQQQQLSDQDREKEEQLEREEAKERQQTYTRTLKEQIQYKKKLLKVAKQRLSKLQEMPAPTDTRFKTLALLDTLSRLPYHPPREDLIGSSLLEHQLKSQISSLTKTLSETKSQNETLQNQLMIQTDLNKILQHLSSKIHKLIETQIKLKREAQKNMADKDAEYDKMAKKLKEMKLHSRKLVQHSKTLIVDYILASEFNIFNLNEGHSAMHNKPKYLGLLETLLNNAMGLTDENTVDISDNDDPLVRYLLRNNIVVSDKPNQIRLRNLSYDI